MSARKTLLIDGDLVLYKNTVVVEKEVRWDEENHVLWSNAEEAWVAIQYDLDKLFSRFETRECIIALTDSPVFRVAIDPSYKANRAGQRKPICFTAARERLEREYRVVKLPGLEADDVLGIFATRDPVNTIVVSEDKDLRSVPCTLYARGVVTKIEHLDADLFHMAQTLQGDTTDGYKGCPGVGPKKADAILQEAINASAHLSGSVAHCVWPAVVAAFEKVGLTAADALVQARLARILRDSDWNAETKEPILWSPYGQEV